MTLPAKSPLLFRELYEPATNIVLATHIQADGDALGSEYALASFLRDKGKKLRIINHDPVSNILKFIDDGRVDFEVYDAEVHDSVIRDADLVMLVDNSAPDRLGRMESVMSECGDRVLCIDHHAAREAPWKFNIVDVESCATTAMIYDLTTACQWRPDLPAAVALFVGLATDTGFFRFNSSNARGHRIAAHLLDIGVNPAAIYRSVYERNSEAFTRLLGHALAGLRFDAGGALASVKITRQLIEALQADDVDTSEITTSLLAMDGVQVALLFRELSDDRIKVSLRSKGSLDVHTLATEFGGGGHRNASGIVVEGRLDQVVHTVNQRATSLLDSSSS